MFFSKAKPVATPLVMPEGERRRSARHATVMQVAKMRLPGGREELCILRDVSPEGLKAQLYIELLRSTPIEFELRTGHLINGKVAWADGAMIGVQFDAPVPMSALLAHCSFDDRLGKLRPPRLEVNLNGMLRIEHEERIVRIGNISQAGMQIEAPLAFHAGAPCMIALPSLAPRPATVRWSREGDAGLMLAEPFDYAEFAEWRSSIWEAA